MQQTSIAFIGAGNMASAIIGGLVNNGFDPKHIWAADPYPASLETLKNKYGVQTTHSNDEAIAKADTVLLAVKPQVMSELCSSIKASVQKNHPLIVSIAAGITSDMLNDWLGGQINIIRCMPNTPALVQAGATALYANPGTSDSQKQAAESLLNAVGITTWVEQESQLDAVTAVSGSGPAYFFYIIEAMQAAGESLGLSAETAKQLTLQTALGAAKMAMQSDVDAAELRKRVTSPNGTTEAAINALEDADLKAIFATALTAADERSKSLAKEMKS